MSSEKKGWFSRFKKSKAEPEETVVSAKVEAPAVTPEQSTEKASTPEVEQPVATPEEAPIEVPAESIPPVAHETINAEPEAPENEVKTEDNKQEPAESSEPIAPVEQEGRQAVEATIVEPATASEEPADTEPEEKASWFSRLKKGLKKSTTAISSGITGIFTQAKLDEETLEDLEDLLITSDLGVSVAGKLTEALSKDRYNKEITGEEVKAILADEIEKILAPVAKPLVPDTANKPHVILMAGVNGAGKTTTIGKLAKKFREDGKSVMLAAGDTFRAAAVEQLQVWGDRNNVPVVTKEIGSDAAALAYEAVDRAIGENIDVLLIDTAGRLQNREELMAELAKVVRVIGKKLDSAPHDTVIVLDATTGQNAVHQVEVFQKLANITGVIMTKLDGSAKGGVLVACAEKFGLPVHAIGVGESIEDLQPFDAKEFARTLVGIED